MDDEALGVLVEESIASAEARWAALSSAEREALLAETELVELLRRSSLGAGAAASYRARATPEDYADADGVLARVDELAGGMSSLAASLLPDRCTYCDEPFVGEPFLELAVCWRRGPEEHVVCSERCSLAVLEQWRSYVLGGHQGR